MRGVLARRQALLARIVARARTEFAGYLRFSADELAPGAGVILELLLAALSDGRCPTSAELADYRAYGRGRAEMGIPLDEVLGVWRMSSREILDELATVARTEGVPDALLLTLTNELLDTFDVAIRAYTGGHQEVELARAGREHQQRADFVRALLLGTVEHTEIADEATLFGLDPRVEHVAFRSRTSSVVHEPWLARATLVASIEGDIAGAVRMKPAEIEGLTVGLGDSVPLEQLPESFRQATRALETAVAFGLTGVHDLDGLGLLPAVVAEPDLGDRLVRRYLEPLGTGSSAAMLRETLERHLETGQRVEQTANAMFVHQNTVRYRLGRFIELTDIDPRDPYRAFELWWALQRFKSRGT
ncbi:PucR family transcriptional regulator [Nocardioides immobilis]|uniref:PucR family transcriptional regulator n=2 Tax=Nocardioides immobilis TaxID=2049295 RepID=A0A417Y7Q2_9ACTN|nr:PucR family transcriptional regulator [Nocardioides immobilis]